ncbi:hypothetical protein [Serinicoccus kebangsaanensis]|uniref:hypothetical protein n=1 Tax=Serinicoccus kebangsaanensis TaxID=2602069 RepID=UPI00124E17E8|nr:hypothetical protein [Serinicoccus kebangsaanensis]
MSEDTLNITDRTDLEVAWVMQRGRLDDDHWLRLWRKYRDRADVPRRPITLYRGAPAQNKRGMSWTESRSVAENFAALWGEQAGGAVWTTQAPPSAILGRPSDSEVVVDPRRLGRVTEVRDAAPHEARKQEKAAQQQARDDRRDRSRWQATYDAALRAQRGSGASSLQQVMRARRAADRGRPAGGRPRRQAGGRLTSSAALTSLAQRQHEQDQQPAEQQAEQDRQTEHQLERAQGRQVAVLADADAYLAGIEQRKQDRADALAAEAAQWQAEHDQQRQEVRARRAARWQALREREAALAEQEAAAQ